MRILPGHLKFLAYRVSALDVQFHDTKEDLPGIIPRRDFFAVVVKFNDMAARGRMRNPSGLLLERTLCYTAKGYLARSLDVRKARQKPGV